MSIENIVNQQDIQKLISTDNLLLQIHDKYGQPPNWKRPPGFVSLSKIILEQHVSLASANSHFLKLNKYLKAFTPQNILKLSDTEMRDCQVSRQKANYLRELSSAIIRGDLKLNELLSLDDSEIRSQLTSIKGIGDWTADIYFMFCLQAKDIFPIGDIAIVNTIKELSAQKTQEEILRLAERWKPLRSLAAYFLWHHYLRKRNRLSSE